jgi:hypothetical protein
MKFSESSTCTVPLRILRILKHRGLRWQMSHASLEKRLLKVTHLGRAGRKA